MESPTRIRSGTALVILVMLLCARCHASEVRDRAVDFFSLLKNHLLPHRPAAPDPSTSTAQRTEVRGNCLHEYYAIQAGVPLTLTSTNYPAPYPPGECRKLVLTPADGYTAVVMVCTDVDTFGTGVLGKVTGDMLEFPGPVVNRRVHTVYGVDVTQCAAVPFAKRSAPGQALKMGFFSDEFVQRRGFSCQVWGEAVPAPPPGQVEYDPGPAETGGSHHQHQQQLQHHQEQPQILQHQFQPDSIEQQSQFQQQPFQHHHQAQQSQFQQQPFQQPFQQQQFQQQPFQQQPFQQQEFQQQEQFQPQSEQQEFKEQQQQPPDTQSLITSGFQQVLPLLNIPGYRRPPAGGGNPAAPPRHPNFGALQGIASLFVPYSAPRQSRPSRHPTGLRGPSRGSRSGLRRPRRLRGPRQRIVYQQPGGQVRFPGQRQRRRRSLAELLQARILNGGRGSGIQSLTTTTVPSTPVVAEEENQWDAVFEDEELVKNKHTYPSAVSKVFRPHKDSGGFSPPDNIEYIFTPVRFPPPFDPERKGPPPYFKRERVTSNTTESPVKVVPFVVTPGPVILRASTDGAQVLSHWRPPRPEQFPTTPPPKVQKVRPSRRPEVERRTTMSPTQHHEKEETTANGVPRPQVEAPSTVATTVRPKKTTSASLERIDVGKDERRADSVKDGTRREEASDADDKPVSSGGDNRKKSDNSSGGNNRKKGGTREARPKVKDRPSNVEKVEEARQPIRRVDKPKPKPKPRTTQKPRQEKPEVDRPNEEGCGLAGPGVQARVFGGEDALPGSYPWVVYLVSDSPEASTKTTYCTGSLISRRWVLTAAHCIDYAVSTTISMGYLDVSKETNLTLKMTSSEYRVHPYWTHLAKEHDVGLVKLPREVPWTDHVAPICLPRRSEVGNTFVNSRAEICGWGKTYTDQKGGSFVLQRAEVPIRSNCDCMASFPINMTPLKICAHGRFHSPCKGDSGGPLQVRRDGRYTLLGVSSFTSAKGCDAGMPAIYTRVTAYLDWIQNNSGLVVPL